MSYEKEIELVEGTHGFDIPLQAQDKDGNAKDLTGCTVKWHIYEDESGTCVLLRTCTADDLPNGKVKYPLLDTDWGSGGTAQLEGGKDYRSSLIATKTGYREEFPYLLVKTKKQAPIT